MLILLVSFKLIRVTLEEKKKFNQKINNPLRKTFIREGTNEEKSQEKDFFSKRICKWKKIKASEEKSQILCRICEQPVKLDKMIVKTPYIINRNIQIFV